jgi:hypothetical protein
MRSAIFDAPSPAGSARVYRASNRHLDPAVAVFFVNGL